jgi:hypothetical protein
MVPDKARLHGEQQSDSRKLNCVSMSVCSQRTRSKRLLAGSISRTAIPEELLLHPGGEHSCLMFDPLRNYSKRGSRQAA